MSHGRGPFDDSTLITANPVRQAHGLAPFPDVATYRAATLAEHARRTASPALRRRYEQERAEPLVSAQVRNDQILAALTAEASGA
jgi:hypothetical protein